MARAFGTVQTDRKVRLALAALLMLGAFGLALAGVVLGAALCICGALFTLYRRISQPVLAFHSVTPDGTWLPWHRNICSKPDVFAAQMAHLSGSGWTVVPSRDISLGRAPQARSCALHFDDGYLDFLIHAAPVLRAQTLPATVYVSVDFIDPSSGIRDQGSDHRGYLNADELRVIDADPLFSIECHGLDHARLAVSDQIVASRPPNWDDQTSFLWSLMPGSKARWFDQPPPAMRDIPENDSALCAQAVGEAEQAQRARVTNALTTARERLSTILGREVVELCWPFDRVTPLARAGAVAAGFERFTAGRQANVAGQPNPDLHRVHISPDAAGPGPVWLDVLILRARLEVASGNLLWWPLQAFATWRRRRFHKLLHSPSVTT